MSKDLENIERKLNLKFNDKSMLKSAFIHRSYLNEHPEEKLPHNERLEFLGDAILGMIVSEYLFKKYPNNPEGDLTNFRSSVVNAKSLSKASLNLNLGSFLFLSKGEEATGGRDRQFILANTFESLIGAMFIDLGLEQTRKFIHEHLLPFLPEIIEKKLYKDYKSTFQEYVQEKDGSTPIYKIIKEIGPDHAKIFKSGVFIDGKKISEGEGNSKQEAEQQAARSALANTKK